MYRFVMLFALALALFAPRAEALEMFTSFHNGENIGFPPMEVPIDVYGHGGWQCKALCRPQRIQSIEPVPAMTPTGFVRCNSAATTSAESYAAQAAPNNGAQYVADRRRSWGRYSDGPSTNYYNNNYSNSYPKQSYGQDGWDDSAVQNPTPAKRKAAPTDSAKAAEAPPNNQRAKQPVSVFARPGNAPNSKSVSKPRPPDTGPSDSQSLPAPGESSRRAEPNLHAAVGTAPADHS